MIKTMCLECGEQLEVPSDRGGQTEQCPSCGRNILVPNENRVHERVGSGSWATLLVGKTTRNKARAMLVVAVMAIAVIMGLYPPWILYNSEVSKPWIYAPVYDPPSPQI